jgi:uncharacterized protein YqeY
MGSIKEQIDRDLKQAMLAGDKNLTMTLRIVKSAILNAEVATNKRDQGLSNDEVIVVLQKEAKKRQESADLYKQGNNFEKAEAELDEKTAIEKYLPEQLSEEELTKVIDKAITETGAQGMQSMGQVIGTVKQQVGVQADGAIIARIVKEKLS